MTAPVPDPDRLLAAAAAQFDFGAWELALADERFTVAGALATLLPAGGGPTLATLLDALLEPGRTALTLAVQRARQQGHPWDFGARLRDAQGVVRYVQLRGHALQVDDRITHLRGAVQVLPAATGSVEARDSGREQRALLQRLELAVASAGVGFFEVDIESGEMSFSARMREIYGLRPDDPVPLREDWRRRFVHPADYEEQLRRVQDGEAVGAFEFEHRIRRTDGVERWVYTHAVLSDPRDGRRWLGIAMDITERKTTEHELREALERLELATTGAGVGIWTRALDQRRAQWSDANFHLYGLLPRAQAPDWDELLALVHPEDRAGFVLQWQRLTQSTEFVDSEFRVCRPDGETRWLQTRGRLDRGVGGRGARVAGIAVDITEQRRARSLLDAAQQRLRLAAEAGRFASWERDLDTGEGRWDPLLFDFYGLPRRPEAPPLQAVLPRIHPDDVDVFTGAWARLRDVSGVTEWSCRVVRPDGSVVHLVSRAYAERRADGSARRVVGASFDVTESRAAAQALQRTLERLQLATETGAVGVWERDLVTDAAHWDPVLFQLYGLQPRSHGPSRAEAESYLHPEDRATALGAWQRLLAATHAVEFEFRVVRPDGGIAFLNSRGRCIRDAHGKPVRVVGATIDITASRQAQRQLRELDELMQLASSANGMGFFRATVDGSMSYADAQLRRLFGFDPDGPQPSSEDFAAAVLPEDRPIIEAARVRGRASREPVEAEYRVRRPDGAIRHVFTRRTVVRDEHGRPLHVVGTALDVTEMRAAEREREHLAQRIEIAATQLQLGLWEWDPQAHVSVWNDQMYALFGRTRAEFAALTWIDAVHPEDRGYAQAELDEVVRHGRAFDIEFRVVWPDGQVRWLATRGRARTDTQGRTTQVVGVNWDITERRLADSEREALATRIQIAADAARIGLWERDLDGRGGSWNQANFALWGFPPGSAPPDLDAVVARVHPEDRAAFAAQFDAAVAGREPGDLEYRVVHGDGRTVVLRTRVRRLGGAPQRRGIVGVNIDVTRERAAEQALLAKEVAERANEAKTEFLSRMSHELRTPLNAILGFAQLLELNQAEPLSAQQRGNVEHIQTAGWHLVSLIDDVLDLARIESGRMALSIERLPLGDVVAESLALIRGEAAARALRLESRVLPDAPEQVLADRVRLKQVLANLLSNAVKYNRPEGSVTVALGRSGNDVQIAVHDTGRGMTPAQLEHIFEPFNRLGLENSGIAGTGIGLSISRRLVLQMRGTIEVRSEPGVGTSFIVTLPTADTVAALPPPATPRAPLQARPDVVGTVLYVEDNASNTQFVEQLLALRPRVKLLTARDGAGAQVLAAVSQPDLVLIDMRLPDGTGLDVLRALRRQSHTAGLACVAVSANALPEDIAAAHAAGFDDYLTKPFDAERLLACIDQRLARGVPDAARATQARP